MILFFGEDFTRHLEPKPYTIRRRDEKINSQELRWFSGKKMGMQLGYNFNTNYIPLLREKYISFKKLQGKNGWLQQLEEMLLKILTEQ